MCTHVQEICRKTGILKTMFYNQEKNADASLRLAANKYPGKHPYFRMSQLLFAVQTGNTPALRTRDRGGLWSP